MLAFWDIDTQYDFMNKNGLLYVPNSEKIIPNLKKLTEYALKKDILILGSVDRHFEDDKELKIFGKHCMDKTKGQKKISETLSKHMMYVSSKVGMYGKYIEHSNDEIQINIKSYNHIIFEKQNTDVFTNRNVIKYLNKLRISEMVVYGVSTEYCVKDAVLGLLKLGIKVYLIIDSINSINDTIGDRARDIMYEAGAILLNTKSMINTLNNSL